MSSLAIVTPWKDHLELCDDYFGAIEVGKPDQLVVVDDGSEPELTFAAIRIPPSGFCTASNAGLEFVETDHVLFLNNDIRALRASWLDDIRAAIEPEVLVGPLRFDKHGNVDDLAYPYVDGWCLGMTTEDARRLGGFDTIYDQAGPSYYSDNAFSLSARLAGMRLRELRPGLFHKGGQTGGFGPAFQRALTMNAEVWKQQVREKIGQP